MSDETLSVTDTDPDYVTLYADNNSADDAVAIVYGEHDTLVEVAVLWCQAGPENKRGFGTNDDDVMLDAMTALNRTIVPECEPPSVTDSDDLVYVRFGFSKSSSAGWFSVLRQNVEKQIDVMLVDDEIINAYYFEPDSEEPATWIKGSAHSHETLLDAINELSR